MKETEELTCCEKIMTQKVRIVNREEIIQANYDCEKCGKFIKMYPNCGQAQKSDEQAHEKTLVDFWIEQLRQRGYYVIKDTEYNHHGEVILRELQEDLSSLEMKILGEVKEDQAIIYLQPESCCSLADEYEREPIKLPLIQLPANTKGVKYFDYFPFSWKYPPWGQDEEAEKGTLKDIWQNRDKSSHAGTYFPKAKTELIEKLVNKGFQWEGGEEKDNYLRAICPRCGWTYNFELTEKYMKVEEQKEMKKLIKNHEC